MNANETKAMQNGMALLFNWIKIFLSSCLSISRQTYRQTVKQCIYHWPSLPPFPPSPPPAHTYTSLPSYHGYHWSHLPIGMTYPSHHSQVYLCPNSPPPLPLLDYLVSLVTWKYESITKTHPIPFYTFIENFIYAASSQKQYQIRQR